MDLPYLVAFWKSYLEKKTAAEIAEGSQFRCFCIKDNVWDTMDFRQLELDLAALKLIMEWRLFVCVRQLLWMLDGRLRKKGDRESHYPNNFDEVWGRFTVLRRACPQHFQRYAQKSLRPETLTIAVFMTKNWKSKEEGFSGMTARVIQHEYDHFRGILFCKIISKG